MAQSILVKAIFKGKDGSLGYSKMSEYLLKITTSYNGRVVINDTSKIGQRCEYSTIVTFLQNWTFVREI